jgi:hypothetical protein
VAPYQRVHAFGTTGRIEIEIPFNAPSDRPCRLWHQVQNDIREIVFDTCNQYTLQGDLFAQAILDDSPVPTPLSDGVANMRAIEAIFDSAQIQSWVSVPS